MGPCWELAQDARLLPAALWGPVAEGEVPTVPCLNIDLFTVCKLNLKELQVPGTYIQINKLTFVKSFTKFYYILNLIKF